MRTYEGKSFKWIIGGIGWPSLERAGFTCVVGSCQPSGLARPQYHLLREATNRDIPDLCGDIFEMDVIFGPEVWLADNKNDGAVATFRRKNDEVREVLAGKSYPTGQSPLHRRIISFSRSPLLEMNNGEAYSLSILRKLLEEERLILPKESKILHQLRAYERGDPLSWEEWPELAALSFCVFELERITDNELSAQNSPPPKRDYDRLRYRKNRR